MRATSGRPLGVLAWTIVVTGALAGLLISGHGTLAGPPLAAPADWRAWATDREPQEALVALLRLAALGLSWYLVATTLANLVARAIGAGLLVRLVDSLTLPVLRPGPARGSRREHRGLDGRRRRIIGGRGIRPSRHHDDPAP